MPSPPPIPPRPRPELLGRIAVRRGFITEAQLQRALEEQSQLPPGTKLGVILLRLGWISPDQWKDVLEEYEDALRRPAEASGKPLGEAMIGSLALQAGLITADQLHQCVRLQGLQQTQGRPVRLGQILVDRGHLTPSQIQGLLARQQKVLVRCTGCGRQFNIVRPEGGRSYRCPICGCMLMSPALLGDVGAEGSWITEPGSPDRVAEEVDEGPAAPCAAPAAHSSAAPAAHSNAASAAHSNTASAAHSNAASAAHSNTASAAHSNAASAAHSNATPAAHSSAASGGAERLGHGAPAPHAGRPPQAPRYRKYEPTPPEVPAPGRGWRVASIASVAACVLIALAGFGYGLFAPEKDPSVPPGASDAPLARGTLADSLGRGAQAPLPGHALPETPGDAPSDEPDHGTPTPPGQAPPETPDLFDTALAAARKKLDSADFAAALSAVSAIEKDPAIPQNTANASAIADLRQTIRKEIRAAFDRLCDEIDARCTEGKFDEAEALLARAQDFGDPEIARSVQRLSERLLIARQAAALASIGAPPPSPEELGRWRTEGEARVKAARDQNAAEAEEGRVRLQKQKDRIVAATTKDPLDIQWSDKLTLKGCRVSDFTSNRVRIVSKSPPVEMEGPWEGLPHESVYEIRRNAIDPEDAKGWFDLGRFLALKRMSKQAVEAFDRSLKLDPSLRAIAPDRDKVLNPPTLFHATNYRVTGGFVHLLYDFKSPGEALDFTGAEARVKDGRLEISGRGAAACTIQDIPFQGKVCFELDPVAGASSWLYFGLMQTSTGGKRRVFRVIYFPGEAVWNFMEAGEDVAEAKAIRWTGTDSRKPRFVLKLDGAEFSLSIDGTEKHRSRIPKIDQVQLFVGGLAVGQGFDPQTGQDVIGIAPGRQALVTYERIEVTGGVPNTWLSKVRSSEAAMFERELEDGLKVKPGETTSRLAHPFREAAWSAYPAEWRTAYDKSFRAMDTFLQYSGLADYMAAASALASAVQGAPRHPGVWFLLGEIALWSGEEEHAIEAYRKAIEFDPFFLEARVALAERLTDAGDFAPARDELTRTLAVRPDFAPALVASGTLSLYERKYGAALDALGVARRLDPSNPKIPVVIRAVCRVRDGPAWSKSYEAKARRHRVVTDISDAAAKTYAKHLDAIWSEYVRVCGVDPAHSRPVDVLVFNDDERFHTYSELTLDDRMESVLGYFHPLYWQIHIFEDAKVEETYRVLYHEGFHYYARLVFKTLPIWLNEGLAEYVGGTAIEGGAVKRRGLVHHGRLNDLIDAMNAGWEPVPFAKMAVMSQPEFYEADAPIKYAQAWSVVHFLMEGGDADLKAAFTAYLALLREGKRAEEAYGEAFTGAAEPSQWEGRWLAYVKGLKAKGDEEGGKK